MIELSFPVDLYAEAAVVEAIRAYHEVAECELTRSRDRCVVRVSSTTGADEQLLADELGNYALGLTVERHGGS